MAVYLTSLVVCLCGVELLIRAPLFETVATLLQYSRKSGQVIASKHISDHWKEKVLPAYSQKVFVSSLKLLVIFVLLFAVLGLIAFALDYVFLSGTATLDFLSSGLGILYATVVSVGYYYARSRLLGK